MPPAVPINDPADPRLDPYRNLRDRVLRKAGNRFIAESRCIVLRMIEAGITPESVVVDARRADDVVPAVPAGTPVYVVPPDALTQLAGFEIHTGTLAVARRPDPPTLDCLVADARFLLVLSQLKETANLGSIIRTAAAFGVGGLLLGPQCCDPYYRRAVRVSMGAVFRLPILTSTDLAADLARLRDDHACRLAATTLDADATPLHHAPRPDRLALLLGHEVHGLPRQLVDLCHDRLTIAMAPGVDSLNVSASAAVFCHHFTRPTA